MYRFGLMSQATRLLIKRLKEFYHYYQENSQDKTYKVVINAFTYQLSQETTIAVIRTQAVAKPPHGRTSLRGNLRAETNLVSEVPRDI